MEQSKEQRTQRCRRCSGSVSLEEQHQGACDEEIRTPERLISTVCLQEATSALNRLHVVDSPKSRVICSDGNRSRLNTEAKPRVLFCKKQENVSWSDDELYSLVLFMMSNTDGKTWVAHKDHKFWSDAGVFIQQQLHTSHCRTGNTSCFYLIFICLLLQQVCRVDREYLY